jgi:hypothetical protein
MGGYLTYAGKLDRARLGMLLKRLADMEQSVLEERAAVRGRCGRLALACLALLLGRLQLRAAPGALQVPSRCPKC